MDKHRSILFIKILSVAALITLGVIVVGSIKVKNEIAPASGLSESKIEVQAVEEENLDIPSPDGTYTLALKNGRELNGIVTQIFFITSESSATPIKIFEKDSNEDSRIVIPENTFSPDNKFVFLKFKDLGKTRYIVLRTDGKDIKEDTKSVEIESLFSEAHPDFVITDVTGWGANGLIVVNTDDVNGKIGPSWWFDLSNFSFIRLSTRFN